MATEDSRYRNKTPGLIALLATISLGSGLSFLLATYLLDLSSVGIALLAGAVSSFLGFTVLGESIGDALVFSFILLFLAFLFLKMGPEISVIRTAIVPIATGISVGKLVHGLWKELST